VVSASVSPATGSGRGDQGSRVRCQSVVPSQMEKRRGGLCMYKLKKVKHVRLANVAMEKQ